MKPETAVAIARRIGLVPSDCDGYWHDPQSGEANINHCVVVEYLLTGDRPLRVMESFLSADGSFVVERKEGMVTAIWRPASRFGTPAYGEGDTPAAAILACAEAMEEGR